MNHLLLSCLHDVGVLYKQDQHHDTGTPLHGYRQDVSLDVFLSHAHELLKGTPQSTPLKTALLRHIVTVIGPHIDGTLSAYPETLPLSREFLLRQEAMVSRAFLHHLVQEALTVVEPASSISMITTPKKLSPQEIATYRRVLAEQFPLAYPTFKTDGGLLGGLSLYLNGQLTDRSWRTQLTTTLSSLSIS